MQFKRRSDSTQYAVLWWTSCFLIYISLAYYAVRLSIDIASRAFYVQTTINEAPAFVLFPDFMVCSEGLVRLNASPRGGQDGTINATLQNHDISGMTKEELLSKTPCDYGDHTLSLISMNGVPVRALGQSPRDVILKLEIDSKNASVDWEYFSAGYVSVLVIPFEHNPYTKFSELQTGIDNFPRSLANNLYLIQQNNSALEIDIIPKSTKTIREGSMGLFGEHNDELTHSVATTADIVPGPGLTLIKVRMPGAVLNSTQILTTTIPSAFSEWGGAAGALWSIFYIFFGVGRIDAFGLISNKFLRRTTQRHLTDVYGYWRKKAEPTKSQDPTLGNSAEASGLASLDSMALEERSDRETDMPLTIPIPDEHEKAMEDDNRDSPSVLERLRQQDECIKRQMVLIQTQEQQVQKLESDFGKLDMLLRDYYLEMELADEVDSNVERRKCW